MRSVHSFPCAQDVNGDGFDDILVGAWGASSAAGEVLVVFGAENFPAVVVASDLDGTGGFVIRGSTTSDASGYSVAAAGVRCLAATVLWFIKNSGVPGSIYW